MVIWNFRNSRNQSTKMGFCCFLCLRIRTWNNAVKGVHPFPSWAPNDLHRALWKRILAIGHPTYYQMWWRYSLTKKDGWVWQNLLRFFQGRSLRWCYAMFCSCWGGIRFQYFLTVQPSQADPKLLMVWLQNSWFLELKCFFFRSKSPDTTPSAGA